MVSACLGLIHSLEHQSRRYREVAGTSSNQSSLPCSQEYDGVLTGSCVCWHCLPSANGFASRYRPPGADCVIPFDGRSLTARVDHLQHPKASCLRRLNTPTAGALVALISTYNERKESSRNSHNRGTFRRTRGGRLSAYLHIISLSDAGRSSNCRHECLSPYNLFEPLIQCNITFPSRLTTARCYWELFSLLFLHCFIYRRSMPTLQP